jgi:hypothetical protein
MARTHCQRKSATEKSLSITLSSVRLYIYIFIYFFKNASFRRTVVGQEELDSRAVNVRNRDDVDTKAKGQMVPLDEVAAKLVILKQSKSLENKL